MTQEEKQLLLRELCARQFYKTKVLGPWKKDGPCELSAIDLTSDRQVRVFEDWYKIEEVKPYLRPVSSMTKEELDKLNEIISKEDHDGYFFVQEEPYYYGLQLQTSDIGCVTGAGLSKAFDYLNSIHVDYSGLIPNLALEAPEGMYKTE